MQVITSEDLPPELGLAIAYTPASFRAALTIFFELDMRLSRIVAATNEPLLGQMRLSWWRETLSKPLDERPQGDAVLDAIGEHWAGREPALIELVNGWEHLLAAPPLSEDDARSFVKGRLAGLRDTFQNEPGWHEGCAAETYACYWVIADLAANVSLPEEREMLTRLGLEMSANGRLGAPYRGIAVIGALALRSLKKGGRPLMEGRRASLIALRAAIFGR